jgi:hypothetical protein
MEILNLLKGNEQRRTEALWARYVTLLEAENHSGKSVAELEECMKALGKSADDAAADLRALRTARKYQKTIEEGADLDEQEERARAARSAYRAETEALIRQRETEWNRIDAAHTSICNRQSNARRAQNNLDQLAEEHPQLLRGLAQNPAQA